MKTTAEQKARDLALLVGGLLPQSAPGDNVYQQATYRRNRPRKPAPTPKITKLEGDLSEQLSKQLQLQSTNTELKAYNANLRAKLAQFGIDPNTDPQILAQFPKTTSEAYGGLSLQPSGGYGSSISSQNQGLAPTSAQGPQQPGRHGNSANQGSQYGGCGRGDSQGWQ
jgi:hypothetical protein